MASKSITNPSNNKTLKNCHPFIRVKFIILYKVMFACYIHSLVFDENFKTIPLNVFKIQIEYSKHMGHFKQ
ncbi:hypothetical protein BLA29_011277 [Euroglyphus maynei]|uniref:Uncharacterized protein n=1 Tax=Euroglyphus maynei TaxID=6958 RepID=A0A1Y3BXS3_EURMA|nr:hypothetical protein BLA29_011277 [Euroglyphus maynei]